MKSIFRPGHIRTEGIIPFICEFWPNKPLFIIKGCIKGSMFPEVDGIAYLYEDFPWSEDNKISKGQCLEIANENNKKTPGLWVSDEVCEQFTSLLTNS